MNNKTCPLCGKSDDGEKFIGSFCKDCYLSRNSFFDIEKEFEIKRCPTCERVWLGKWTGDNYLIPFIKGKIKTKELILDSNVELNQIDTKKVKANVCATFKFQRNKVEQCKETLIRILPIQCDECSRKTSGYFEAIVQIRGKIGEEPDYDKLMAKAEAIAKKIMKEGAFIAKVEEQKEGIDLYVSNTQTAVSVVAGYGKYALATQLAGQKQGKQLYRTSICIRF